MHANMESHIPETLSYEEACVLPLGLSTAACALFQKNSLTLDCPDASASRTGESKKPTDKALVIWSGSTSVGCNAIQLATAAGYDVVTTASPKNFEFVTSLGATQIFDYSGGVVFGE